MTFDTTIIANYLNNNNLQFHDGNCHSCFRYAGYKTIKISYRKFLNTNEDEDYINFLVQKFNELNFNLQLEKGVIIYTRNNEEIDKERFNYYDLFMYELFRLLITNTLLKDQIIKYKEEYSNMNIWDLTYFVHQKCKAEGIFFTKDEDEDDDIYWDTYYDPFPNMFFKYLTIEQIKKVLSVTSSIQLIWIKTPEINFNPSRITNNPLSTQIELQKELLYAKLCLLNIKMQILYHEWKKVKQTPGLFLSSAVIKETSKSYWYYNGHRTIKYPKKFYKEYKRIKLN